jgi:asparagine synthase (glutamine-hydrolysing)
MTDALGHRGPDGSGLRILGDVGFGHRRLSIIDLEHSSQPMSSRDDALHVCFNGEILNYQDLRHELRDYDYATAGDTEVLLAAYERDGEDSPKRLIGQFAYGLFDQRSDVLWLFRDQLGILPLFYYVDGEKLLFSSEIKAILAGLGRTPDVDLASLADYLGRRSVPAPWTLFQDIHKLPAGHRLRVDRRGAGQPEQYWSLPQEPARRMGSAEATQLVRDRLRIAVERSLVADVPVGAYLSGGLDSSLITALANQARGGEGISTFSAGFDDPRNDELPYARRVSEFLGTDHHEVRVDADDFIDLWPTLTWYRDSPISEASDVAVYQLAKLARQHVKVVLSGEGSDELFGGYPKYRLAAATAAAGLVPAAVRRRAFNGLADALPSSRSRARIALRALTGASEADRLEGWFAPFTSEERTALLGVSGHGLQRAEERCVGDALQRMSATDVIGWLPDNLLERADRMSMATSLETRPPFLQVDMVEAAFAVPSKFKAYRGTTKWVVKEVARGLVPPDIISRPKVGFRVPLDTWLRSGLVDYAHDQLLGSNSFSAEVLGRATVQELLQTHLSGRRREELRLWTLLSLEVWHDVYFKRSVAPTAVCAS